MKESRFRESTSFNNQKIDRENHVIHDVKVLGSESANGRIYTAEAMKNALALYEGTKVYVDHVKDPTANRSYRDKLGNLQNARVQQEANGKPAIFADLQYNPGHAVAEQLIHDAEAKSNDIGLSHAVLGKHSLKDGKQIVENIDKVFSVDVVLNPATTNGLFESLKEEMEITDVDGLKAAMAAIMDNAELDLPGMASALCELAHPLLPKEEPKEEVPAEKPAEEPAKEESKADEVSQEAKLLEQIKSLQAELDEYKVREAIQNKKIKLDTQIKEAKLAPELVTDVFVSTLMEAKEDMVAKLIEDRKTIAAVGQKPVSKESHGTGNLSESVKDTNDFVSRLKK
jgi:hypothetical protein